ncbi:MAG: 5'-nucleotidase C-terminal domain-containing protein [Bacteroidales bacterium]|nr:5'-nucleotidase C-terminal domain-containing protein [Bacteroidales bacterium]MBQ3917135.1 5'-nucleotidase C-terminal domain-containing protein [Bacteroidales bacterium]
MKKLLFITLLAVTLCGCRQQFVWERTAMDGSRTGVQACSASDVAEKLGTYSDGVYTAPDGKVFSEGCTPEVARILLESQETMADLKTVIARSTRAMVTSYPECELGDWFIDELMRAAERKSGKKVDVGITNFGGIRVDMPEGDVLKDDIMSMFPFKNNLCYLELYGRDIRVILEQLASTSWQVVGGARCVVRNKVLESVEIGGEPLDDDKIYGVATISFLLDGGDGLRIAKNAVRLDIYDEYILDVMMPYVESLTAAGKPIEYQMDGRITIINDGEKETLRR